MCEASKHLSALQHDRKVREERLASLENDLSRMRIINSTDYDEDREQVYCFPGDTGVVGWCDGAG